MLAVILAAGKGKRLKEITKDMPKCLIEIGGKSIIERQIEILNKNGINEIYVVVGYKANEIMKKLNGKVNFILNEDYEKTDNLYSLYLAKNFVKGREFILLNGDAIFDEEIIKQIIMKDGNRIPVDKKHYDKEELKIKGDEIAEKILPKSAAREESDGSTIGIFKFSPDGSKILFDEIEGLVEKGMKNRWFEYAINKILNKTNFYIEDISNYNWMEIDTMQDLKKAREIWK